MTWFRKHNFHGELRGMEFFLLEKREDRSSDSERSVKKASIKRRIMNRSPQPLFLRQEIIDIIYSKGDLS